MLYTNITVVAECTVAAELLIVYFTFSQRLQQLRCQAYVNWNLNLCIQTDVSKRQS
jgi:hypothetical protein